MELSKRLQFIASHIEQCNCIADIGTDHGYIPIYLIKNNLCKKTIASDINKDPLDKCKLNSVLEEVWNEVECRLGGGLSTLKPGEAQGAVIAGMGGNLIRDILEDNMDITESLDYIILQPAQNPEVLREYLYTSGYEIIDEDLCYDEGIYYELFKVKRNVSERMSLQDLFYEISPRLLRVNHPLMKEYLIEKKNKYTKILALIQDPSESAQKRKQQVLEKLDFIDGLIESR
ncbi:MAG: tRNA (adenine(22)-N(1))-methyltransferase [Clostridium sp.]